MAILVICRVIDNFGDAGFSLRLSLALAKHNYEVHLLCDDYKTLSPLLPAQLPLRLSITSVDDQAGLNSFLQINGTSITSVLECFGSSSVPNSAISNTAIREALGQQNWLIIDYLSAEQWTESLHGLQSIDPSNGYSSRYFYPGFTSGTGGLIHADFPTDLASKPPPTDLRKIFLFSYPNAPIQTLADSLEQEQHLFLAGSEHTGIASTRLPFKPIDEFDHLLNAHDFLFVRGEDSFMRAQLSGRPFVWQIYPTEDMAHVEKLDSFFKLYAQGLDSELKAALWSTWRQWNSLQEVSTFRSNWVFLSKNYERLTLHAQRWQSRLVNGKELVREVLTLLGE